MVNFPIIVNAVPKHLNSIAKNKTLKEFAALCSACAAIFFGGLTIVIIRAKPIEEDKLFDDNDVVRESDEKE